MPYPYAATGPKPKSRRAGLPQLDVERIEVFKTDHPWSVKMLGRGLEIAPFPLGLASLFAGSGVGGGLLFSLWIRQYSAKRWL